jgi:bla regulator protein BlaR1
MTTMLSLLRDVSLCLLLILALRPLLRRWCGAGTAYATWVILPLTLLASILPHPTTNVTWIEAARVPLDLDLLRAPAPAVTPDWLTMLWAPLWLAGSCALLLAFVFQQWRFRRNLGPLRAEADGSFSASLSSAGPAVIGLLRPRIILPSDFSERYTAQEQSLILQHERVHLRRGDLFFTAISALLRVAFWFNPLVHIAARSFQYDQELACDQAVLRGQPQARRAYAEAILKTQMASSGLPFACTWQFRHPLKGRIMSLTKSQPPTLSRRAGQSLIAVLALGACYGAWAGATPEPVAAPMAAAPAAPAAAPVAAMPQAAPKAPATGKAVLARAPSAQADAALRVTALGAPTPPGQEASRAAPGQVLDVEAIYSISGGAERRIRMSGIGSDGGGFATSPESKEGCEDEWRVMAMRDDMASINGAITCNGVRIASPRLVVKIGHPGTVEVGGDGQVLRFKLTVLISKAKS